MEHKSRKLIYHLLMQRILLYRAQTWTT